MPKNFSHYEFLDYSWLKYIGDSVFLQRDLLGAF